MWSWTAWTFVALLAFVLTASAASAASPRPIGLPAAAKSESLLFSMQAESGSMKRRSARSYTLTLRRPGRHTVWFTDRPQRDSGRVSTRDLVRVWARLGFVEDRPNAVLATSGRGADEVVVEMGRPRYIAKGRALQLSVKLLGRRNAGLRTRFGSVSLFIDNAGTSELCGYTGEINFFPARVTPGQVGYVRADGRLVPAEQYPNLYEIVGDRYGTETISGTKMFRVPTVQAPSGLHSLVCTSGDAPDGAPPSYDGSDPPTCEIGAVQLFSQTSLVWGFVPAAGQTERIIEHRMLFSYLGTKFGGDGQTTFAAPNVPAPDGMSWQICAFGDIPIGGEDEAFMSQVDFWGDAPSGNGSGPRVQAQGQTLPISQHSALFSLLSTDFGGNGYSSFQLPEVADVVPGVGAKIVINGVYPQPQ